MLSLERGRNIAALLIAFSVCGSRHTEAQTRSEMTGTIRDATGAVLSGVTVTLEGSNLSGAARTTLTDARGVYRLPNLSPGVYALTATRSGLQTVKRTSVRMPISTTLTMDLTLAAAGGPDAATVSGAGSVVDVTAAVSTIEFGREDLESLPVSGLGFLQLGPGITSSAAFGSAQDTNQILIDGSPLVLTIAGIAAPGVHTYWMEEAQIVGVGANADSGEFSGAVANILLRSGSNRWSGLAEYSTGRPEWVGDNTGSLPEALRADFRPQRILSKWTSVGQAGGPIVHDRLFFFTGFRYFRNEVFQAGRIGDVPFDERSSQVLAKLDWVPSNNVRVEGHVETDRNRSKGALARNALPETAGDSTTRLDSWNARATWTLNSRTIAEVRSGGLDLRQLGLPADRRAGPPPRRDNVTGISSGNAGMFSDTFGNRSVTGGSLTRFTDGFAGGSHELKGGFEFERTTSRQVSGVPGGQFFVDALGVPSQMMRWDGDIVEGIATRMTLFAQDSWGVLNRLTIHPGVRVAFNRGAVADKGTVFRTNPVSPRLGVAWDVLSDHRTVVRAAYDRVHEGVSTPVFSFMNTSGLTTRITYKVLGPDSFQEQNRITPGNVAVDDHLTHAYVDQYVVGIERALFADGSITVQYARRNFDEIWARINPVSQYGPVQRQDPGPDGQLSTTDDGEVITVFSLLNPGQSSTVLTNPADAFRRYDSVQVIGEKRYAHNWQWLASYTWSSTRGTVQSSNGANRASSGETGVAGLFSNPNSRINAGGPSSNDYTHQMNVQGTWLLPAWGGVGLSASYRYLSGGAWGRTAQIMGAVRIEPRGTRRVEAGNVLDVRIEKTFPLGGSGPTLGVYADVFNVMNRGVPLGLGVVEASGQTFGDPGAWAAPRTLQVAGRIRF